MQAVLAEQLGLYEQTEAALKSLQMQSEAGKKVHAQLLGGISGIRATLADMKGLNFDTPKAQVKAQELTPKMQKHAVEVMHAMQGLLALMKANGLQEGSAVEAHFHQKMDQLKEKIDQK